MLVVSHISLVKVMSPPMQKMIANAVYLMSSTEKTIRVLTTVDILLE